MTGLGGALATVVLVAGIVSGCTTGSPPATSTSTPAPAPATSGEAWRTAVLHDVVGGADLRIADLRGRLVAIEAMAIWCVNCRLQQQAAQTAIATLGTDDLVYISLDVDPNERDADLADYARREGFDWPFAVASPDVARSLAATFGPEILSPPSTPLVVIGPDGGIVTKHLGIASSDDLVTLFEEHLP